MSDAAAGEKGALDSLKSEHGDVLEHSGHLLVKLATTEEDVAACQRLRYEVFYEEMAAKPIGDMERLRLDFDKFDPLADHLMVVDTRLSGMEAVVGTYRFIRQEIALANGGFYTTSEYDIDAMVANAPDGTNFLELGRSCVHEKYRTKPTINMLWLGLGAYVNRHNVDVLFGCASFPGTDPDRFKEPLSFLYHHLATPQEWYVRARQELFVDMNRMPKDEVSERAALRAMPPLIRGYVRAGCRFGDGAVIDEQFSTVDVFVMSVVQNTESRYASRFLSE